MPNQVRRPAEQLLDQHLANSHPLAPSTALEDPETIAMAGDHFHFGADEQRGLAEREVEVLARVVSQRREPEI